MSGNVSGVYCPGCAPGDFLQPHICQPGGISTASFPSPIQLPPPRPCEHCWCRPYPFDSKPHEQCCMCFTRRLKVDL